jgi:uncharacterized protein YutE (UPF0331/DUF86 family)
MRNEQLALLRGYIKNQLDICSELMQEVSAVEPVEKEDTVFAGYMLHNLYSALEDLFQEIVKIFENSIDDPSKYHRELLKRMSIEVPGIRPSLLSRQSQEILDELRGFRHVFRHSYSYGIDADKVKILKAKILEGWPDVEKDIQQFDEFLVSNID